MRLYVASPLDHLYFRNEKIDRCGNFRKIDYYMKFVTKDLVWRLIK